MLTILVKSLSSFFTDSVAFCEDALSAGAAGLPVVSLSFCADLPGGKGKNFFHEIH